MLQCIVRDLAREAGWVTIQTLYRDCSQLKDKRQGRALCRDTMRCQAYDTALGRGAGRAAGTLRHGSLAYDTARASATIRPGPGHDTTRPTRTWACLGASWASFGARAPGLVFDLVFRLGIVSESPFGPGP